MSRDFGPPFDVVWFMLFMLQPLRLPLIFWPPIFVLRTLDGLMYIGYLVLDDLPPIPHIRLLHSRPRMFLVPSNSSFDVALYEPLRSDWDRDVDEPELIHERSGFGPRLLVQTQVVPLEDDDARRRRDRDVVLHRVFDRVVEARGIGGQGLG